jgi:cytochrome P450
VEAPTFKIDLFSDELLDDPFPTYKTLRDAGPVVYLDGMGLWAITRYAELRGAFKNWETFSSKEGPAFNDPINESIKNTVVGTDPPTHTAIRKTTLDRLRLSAVREAQDLIDSEAEKMVAPLVERGSFDAVADLARVFPAHIVGELLGVDQEMRDKLVEYGDATFNVMGPLNQRALDGFPLVQSLLERMATMTKNDLVPGSMGYKLFEAAERNELPPEQLAVLLWNFTGAGTDTTVSAIGNLIRLLGEHPEQWDMVREDPTMIDAAIEETLRIESPIQIFGRWTVQEYSVDGVTIPLNQRVALLIGSGNRDERHYADPDRFDIRRPAADHLGFGHGIHNCPGANLARLEMQAVIRALVKHAPRLEVGQPVRRLNNMSRGLESLPVSAVAQTG